MATATSFYAPPSPTILSVNDSHAVSRTSELLSCAKTAIKIAKSQNGPPLETDWWNVDPSHLQLGEVFPPQPLLEDGLALLRTMQGSLESLQALVRRRGHTNDPTQEIAVTTQRLETDAKELNTIVQQIQHSHLGRQQAKKHYELVASWMQQVASQQMAKLKDILKVRGTVLSDQAQRRKLLNPSIQKKKTTNRSKLEASPLFTATPGKRTNGGAPPNNNRHPGAGNSRPTQSNGTSTTTGYGGGAGYGGYYGAPSNTGMRQRRAGNNNSNNNDSQTMIQEQILERKQERETQRRLETARETERAIGELGSVFGRMSTIVAEQNETLQRLEDDVEAAMGNVDAGHKEIQTVYSLKKGNRGLIIKTFAVVIFVVIFMRFYRR